MYKILLIGPRFNQNNLKRTGGAAVLFENLISQCEKQHINYDVIDTNKRNYYNLITTFFIVCFKTILKQKEVNHISLHSSRNYVLYGLIIVFIGKIFGKTVSLRKFGGEAQNTYKEANWLRKKILHYIFLNFDFLFFETKGLVNFFSKINKNTFWFPNVRERLLEPSLPREFKKRFVFISHVKKEKGIDEILLASNNFDNSYVFDIYGPLDDEKYSKEYFDDFNVTYKGPLQAKDVLKTLNCYDVLLLPSYKEGYPGIILEAYSLGIPIIATNLPGIEEITIKFETGMLINPRNVPELVLAIEYYNELNYPVMSDRSYYKFSDFDANIITLEYINKITDNLGTL